MTTRFVTIELREKNNVLAKLNDIDSTDSIKEFVEAHTRHIGRYSVSIKPQGPNKTVMHVHRPGNGGLWSRIKHVFASLRWDVICKLEFDHQTGNVVIEHLKDHHLLHLAVAFELENLNRR